MRIVTSAVRFYLVLFGLALFWIYFQQRLNWRLFFHPAPKYLLLDLLLGVGMALCIIILSRFASQNFLWGQLLEKEFRQVLTPLNFKEILAISGMSGFVEELFFRGALQPMIGIIPCSLLFGVVHFVPKREFVPWSFYAIFAGFALGSLYEISRDLCPSIVAHVLVNLVLIVTLNRQQAAQAA